MKLGHLPMHARIQNPKTGVKLYSKLQPLTYETEAKKPVGLAIGTIKNSFTVSLQN
jgi:hypothetical protein